MFATPAFAQTAAGAAVGGPQDMLMQFLPLIGLVVLFYFLMIRPQQKRMKLHQQMITNLKRGDQVILNSGLKGKVVRVEDKEVGLEIATGVTVKVAFATGNVERLLVPKGQVIGHGEVSWSSGASSRPPQSLPLPSRRAVTIRNMAAGQSWTHRGPGSNSRTPSLARTTAYR